MCAKNHREPKAAKPMSRLAGLAEGPQKPARPTFTPQLFKLLGCEISLTTQETSAVVSRGRVSPGPFRRLSSSFVAMHRRSPSDTPCTQGQGLPHAPGNASPRRWVHHCSAWIAIPTLAFLTCTQSIRLLCSSEEGCRTFDSDFCAAVLLIAQRIGFEIFEHVLLCFASKIGPFC